MSTFPAVDTANHTVFWQDIPAEWHPGVEMITAARASEDGTVLFVVPRDFLSAYIEDARAFQQNSPVDGDLRHAGALQIIRKLLGGVAVDGQSADAPVASCRNLITSILVSEMPSHHHHIPEVLLKLLAAEYPRTSDNSLVAFNVFIGAVQGLAD